jgi:hypothetical protein
MAGSASERAAREARDPVVDGLIAVTFLQKKKKKSKTEIIANSWTKIILVAQHTTAEHPWLDCCRNTENPSLHRRGRAGLIPAIQPTS